MSYKIGFNPFFNNYTPVTNELTEMEKEYVHVLRNLPLHTIIDGGEGQKRCHEIGQEIYDYFMSTNNNNWKAGQLALYNISEVLSFSCIDGWERKKYVSYAWAYVGGKEWCWID
jgi:hypothetical protein